MRQEFFTYLPLELIINILSRLPLRAITACKCVCKPWLYLLSTHEFADSHLPNSVPVLVFGPIESAYKMFELDDSLHLDRHDLHYNPVAEFRLCHGFLQLKCSANGLLLLVLPQARPTELYNFLYICNPITREYIELRELVFPGDRELVTHGFGASKITGQLKLVRVIQNRVHPRTAGISKSECHVYTVGTGAWRNIQPGAPLDYNCSSVGSGAFFNGNVHWMVYDAEGSLQISCFDLETECFSTFSPPVNHRNWAKSLFVLEDCLCLCDSSSCGEIAIWSMKEYGVEKSWIKEFVITKNSRFVCGLFRPDYPDQGYRSYVVHPIKVFKDGDILMAWEDFFLLNFSNKTKTTQKIDMFKPSSAECCVQAVLYTPSFVSLKIFPMENVSSF